MHPTTVEDLRLSGGTIFSPSNPSNPSKSVGMLPFPHDDIYDREGAYEFAQPMAIDAWLVSRKRIPLPAMSSQLLDQHLGSPVFRSRGCSTARPDKKRSRH